MGNAVPILAFGHKFVNSSRVVPRATLFDGSYWGHLHDCGSLSDRAAIIENWKFRENLNIFQAMGNANPILVFQKKISRDFVCP